MRWQPIPLTVLFMLVTAWLPAGATVIDFDTLVAGDPVTVIDGVTFDSNLPFGYDLVVASGYGTTSGANYLGTSDVTGVFLGGDEVYLSFASPIDALSVAFIAVPGISGDVFSILTPKGSVTGSVLPDLSLVDGDVYLLSIVLPAPVSSATLASEFGVVSFNIDDIDYRVAGGTMAEPGTLALVLLPLLGLAWSGRRAAGET